MPTLFPVLVQMVTTFEVLDDKRRGRCWWRTKYAVESVSALVFDLDRVPPDPKRLEHV
jgi:hypothetical protein